LGDQVSFLGRRRKFPLSHSGYDGSGTHPLFYTVHAGDFSWGIERPEGKERHPTFV